MKKLFSLLLILLALSCCSLEDDANLTTQNPVDVYIAGQKNGHACYWKNNQEYLLNDNGFLDSEARKIIVSNNNVYVLGKSSDGTALFWKNNIATNLSTTLSSVNHAIDNIGDMEIAGNDIYFSGQVINSDNAVETFNISYWKNGQPNIIDETTSPFVVHNLASYLKVINNNVIVGYEYGYSINTIAQNQNIIGRRQYGIALINNNAYIYGENHVENKAYYKNIFTQNETTVNSITKCQKLVFDLNDIYISDGLNIYKNNNLVFQSTDFSYYKDFTALNGNLYILKAEGDLGGEDVLLINDVNAFSMQSSTGSFNAITIVQNPI